MSGYSAPAKKAILRTLVATMVAFVFVIALPMAVSAAPAVTNLEIDRTSITPGQNITFSVRTTAQVNFVFAVVDGVTTQGVRVAPNSNEWTITISPSGTGIRTVSVFANTSNSQSGAARLNVPIIIAGAAATPTPSPTAPVIPPAPANLGPVAIASVTETPAQAAGFVQLTVVTGRETNEVWVNFDRPNNVRRTGRFARGTMLTQDANSRTWVINFRPAAWTPQQVEVGSNRTYDWPGAATRTVDLTLTQPFVAPLNPTIQNVTVNNSTVAPSANVTFTIRTNTDVEYVWVRDVNGNEHNANRTQTTTTARTWNVTFNPQRTGSVTVFANAERNTTGAAQRSQSISVTTARAQIVGTPTAVVLGVTNNTRVTVTTNRYAETVWVEMGAGMGRVELTRTDSGTGNRTWQRDVWDVVTGNINIVVGAVASGGINATPDDTRTITRGGTTGTGIIHSITPVTPTTVTRGSQVTFRVQTSADVHQLIVPSTQFVFPFIPQEVIATGTAGRAWDVTVAVEHSAPTGQSISFNIQAIGAGGVTVATQAVTIHVTS
ncbi:MAG: hypothetical protein FWF79_05455 [Defluviitaleaceae bacterium]|nr:hypothetical protein [Defluviitaleaceae bacterium]